MFVLSKNTAHRVSSEITPPTPVFPLYQIPVSLWQQTPFTNVASFGFGTNVHVFRSKPVTMCSCTDASGAYLPVTFSTKCIHLINLLPTIACEKQEQQLTFVTKKLRSLKLRKLRSLIHTWQMGRCIPIHTAACRSSSTSWLDCGIQFRLKRSRSPLYFLVDAEL